MFVCHLKRRPISFSLQSHPFSHGHNNNSIDDYQQMCVLSWSQPIENVIPNVLYLGQWWGVSQSCKHSELQIQVRRSSKVQYILTEMDTTYTLKWQWICLENNICFSFRVKSIAQYYHYSFLMDFKTVCLQGQWCYHFTHSSIQIDKQTKNVFSYISWRFTYSRRKKRKK